MCRSKCAIVELFDCGLIYCIDLNLNLDFDKAWIKQR